MRNPKLPSLHESLLNIGLSETHVRYLKERGTGKSRTAALSTKGGLHMNGKKASRFFHLLCERTGWHDEDKHIKIGQWLNDEKCPVEIVNTPCCPECKTEELTRFSLHPLEEFCDFCLTKKISDYMSKRDQEQVETAKRAAKLAQIISKADKEAEETGEISIPTMDVLMTGAAHIVGGWAKVIESYANAMNHGTPREKFAVAKEMFAYAAMREKKTEPAALDITGCENPEEMKKLIADALLSQWHRKKERVALRDLIPQYGGVVPDEDDDDE